MKFCRVGPEICRGQVHASRKERIRIIIIKIKIKIKIITRNGAKTISPPKLCLGDLIIRRNGAKTISLQTLFGGLNYLINNVSHSYYRPTNNQSIDRIRLAYTPSSFKYRTANCHKNGVNDGRCPRRCAYPGL
jgi:hypothetical protein